MKVVTNSTPLIALSKINRLELLREVHRSIYIPEEVYTEVVVNGVGKPGAAEVASADWIICQPVTDKDQVLILHNRTLIDLGECGAIVLAQEIGAERIIIDDRVARQVAIAKGLSVIGTVGVLRVAKAWNFCNVLRQGYLYQINLIRSFLIKSALRGTGTSQYKSR